MRRRADLLFVAAAILASATPAQAADRQSISIAPGRLGEAAIALGDPFLAGHRLRGASPNRIVARLGPAFAEGVAGGEAETWFGPVESAFGQHLVWIHDRIETRIPALDEIRNRVLEDWIEQESRRVLREHVDQRRTQVEIRILEDTGAMSREPAAG